MTLEKARKIQKLCNKIDKIEQNIEELNNCAYIQIHIRKAFVSETNQNRVYKNSRTYSHILQAYKEERDALIKKLNDM